jgi:hypothetical protein
MTDRARRALRVHLGANVDEGLATVRTAIWSANRASRVWFTLSHGILNEIYYPRVDNACTRDLGFIVTDGESYFSEEKRDAHSEISQVQPGIPAYRLHNTPADGRYRIEKEILTDRWRDVVLQRVRFVPLQGTLADFHLYVLLALHLANAGAGNTAWVGDYKGSPMLFAERQHYALALVSSTTDEKQLPRPPARRSIAARPRAATRHVIVRPVPPFRLDLTVWALRRRARNAIDRWDDGTYRRAIVLAGLTTELSVRQLGSPDAPRLVVTTTPSPRTAADRRRLRSVIDRLLGTAVNLDEWYRMAAHDQRLGVLAERFRGLKPHDSRRCSKHSSMRSRASTVARGGTRTPESTRWDIRRAVRHDPRWSQHLSVCPRHPEASSIAVSRHRFQPSEGPGARRACRRCRTRRCRSGRAGWPARRRCPCAPARIAGRRPMDRRVRPASRLRPAARVAWR